MPRTDDVAGFWTDDEVDALSAELQQINDRWARRVFSDAYGMRSAAGKRIIAELQNARHLSRD